MTQHQKVTHQAADPKHGMTLDELAAFVQHAMRVGASGREKVEILVNMRRGAKSASINIEVPS